jgi:hypothetical protein
VKKKKIPKTRAGKRRERKAQKSQAQSEGAKQSPKILIHVRNISFRPKNECFATAVCTPQPHMKRMLFRLAPTAREDLPQPSPQQTVDLVVGPPSDKQCKDQRSELRSSTHAYTHTSVHQASSSQSINTSSYSTATTHPLISLS